ncbi:unnamed protein product [Nippostrongylus brasiliensis]|uniref:Universal stress protein n=1 Tax=Nippostrongylus brasiliensis TaxID=27835 RepID=A0A0N4XVJ5_NIPBR|nr:unnamed protein product [Nippostrongylus brasiliensis]
MQDSRLPAEIAVTAADFSRSPLRLAAHFARGVDEMAAIPVVFVPPIAAEEELDDDGGGVDCRTMIHTVYV